MKKHTQGFTLIEVLIALAILAIALTAITLATQASIYDTDHVANKLEAHWVAMNVIASMQVGLLPLPTERTPVKGASDMLGKTFSWIAGIDQPGNQYYERIYVDVSQAKKNKITHLFGFVTLPIKDKHEQ